MIHHCMYCGAWMDGPFKGRLDVPEEEVKAMFLQHTGQPITYGNNAPAPRRPGGVFFDAGGNGTLSHGLCPECGAATQAENEERARRLGQRLRPARDAGMPESQEKPEPTEEQAQKLLSGHDDEEEGGA